MSAHLTVVDPMTRQWPIYERNLRALYASMRLPPDKLDHIMGEVRDAYLRSAPSLEEIPECPPAVHRYVFDVTLRLLGQVARKEAQIWDTDQMLKQGIAAMGEIVKGGRHG